MSEYTAILANNSMRIIRVSADNLQDAKDEIIRELSKPGRTPYRDLWIKQGCYILGNDGYKWSLK